MRRGRTLRGGFGQADLPLAQDALFGAEPAFLAAQPFLLRARFALFAAEAGERLEPGVEAALGGGVADQLAVAAASQPQRSAAGVAPGVLCALTASR